MMKAENAKNPEYTKNPLSYHHLFMPKIFTYIIQWEISLVKQLFAQIRRKACMKKTEVTIYLIENCGGDSRIYAGEEANYSFLS